MAGVIEAVTHSAEDAVCADLAAAHRLCALEGLYDPLGNHISYVSPQAPDRMIVTPYALHWSLISSAELAVINRRGEKVLGLRGPDISAVIIHWPIHDARPDARCLIHVHALYSTVLFMRRGAVLETRASQAAMGFHQRVAYFDEYDGNLSSENEGRRIARALGDKDVLVMRNHGVLVAGDSVGTAFDLIHTFELACRLQFLAEQSGASLNLIPESVVRDYRREQEATQAQLRARDFQQDEIWNGWKYFLHSASPIPSPKK